MIRNSGRGNFNVGSPDFVNGRFVESVGGDLIDVFNPARDMRISQGPDTRGDGVNAVVDAASRAQRDWERLPAIQRPGFLREISAKIRANAKDPRHFRGTGQDPAAGPRRGGLCRRLHRRHGRMGAPDRGRDPAIRPPGRENPSVSPNRSASSRASFSVLSDRVQDDPGADHRQAIVIKPSKDTPNNAALFARLVTETGLPQGVFNIVYGRSGTTGRVLTQHPDMRMVSLTGSVETGSKIMAAAAKNI